DLEPSWSPSGRKITFAILCDGGNLGIWTENVNGTGREQLAGTGHAGPFVSAYQPAWSPNGSSIAFVGVRERDHHDSTELYTVHPDGGGLTRLTRGRTFPSAPAWSPDATQIAFFQYGQGLTLINPNGSGERHLDRFPRQA